jgi:hypothetical protein
MVSLAEAAMSYAIGSVTVNDAPGLSKVMMSAMYRDPHWALLFGSMPLQDIIDACTERLPKALSSNREERRHQKVIDQSTGEIVGYARWILPDGAHGIEWLDAQVPEASEAEMEAYEKAFKAVTTPEGKIRGMNLEMSSILGKKLQEEVDLVTKGGTYLSKYINLDMLKYRLTRTQLSIIWSQRLCTRERELRACSLEAD